MVKWKKNGLHIWRLSVKPGDLVKRKPVWGERVKYDPWMLPDDSEIGMIIQADTDLILVLWPSFGTGWISKNDLEKINESR